ncbi:MAG: hypothetical protein Q8880_13210 [Bacteroidota bacterium]|nr:hypothetical protein [Bacteroidota bacterium]
MKLKINPSPPTPLPNERGVKTYLSNYELRNRIHQIVFENKIITIS